jgi:hypothetical protein
MEHGKPGAGFRALMLINVRAGAFEDADDHVDAGS